MYQCAGGIQPRGIAFVTFVCAASDANVAPRLQAKRERQMRSWGKCPLSFRLVSDNFLSMVGQESLERRAQAHTTPSRSHNLLKRNLPIGAEAIPDGVHFRVWAPASKQAAVQLISLGSVVKEVSLEPEADGYFSGFVPEARAGMLYEFQLDTGAFPDPASRYQPEGPHGPSQ